MKSLLSFSFFVWFVINGSYGMSGDEAELKDAPFIATVIEEEIDENGEKDDKVIGTGVLFKSNFVITAASFFEEETKYKVRVGSETPDDDGELVAVKKVIPHTGFKKDTLENDVAILELDEEVEVTDFAVLPADATVPESIAIGWGMGNLVKAEVEAGEEEACKTEAAIDIAGSLCMKMIIEEDTHSYEDIDLGAPLISKDGNVFIGSASQIGNENKKICFYTPIFGFNKWIEETTKKPDPKPTPTEPPKTTVTTTTAIPSTTAPETTETTKPTKKPSPQKRSSAPHCNSFSLKLLIMVASAQILTLLRRS